jgi:hypothetical protein
VRGTTPGTIGLQLLGATTSAIIGTDPGGSELLRVGGKARISAGADSDALQIDSTNAFGSYVTLRNSGTAYGLIGSSSALTGGALADLAIRAQANLIIAPNAGTVSAVFSTSGAFILGTDPGGSELLRIGGYVNASGLVRSAGANVNLWRWCNSVSTEVVNTVTETTLLGTGVGSKTIIANSLKVGSVIRFVCSGRIGCTGTPNLILKVAIGSYSDELFNDALPTDYSGRWRIMAEYVVNSIGASGTISGMLTFLTGQSGDGFVNGQGNVSVNFEASAETLDTTTGNAFNLTAEWGTANAANTIESIVSTIEVLNATS